MKYNFTDGLTLIRNKEEWEIFEKNLYGCNQVDAPVQYPVLVVNKYIEWSNWSARRSDDEDFIQFIYPQDAQNLIIEYWEQKE